MAMDWEAITEKVYILHNAAGVTHDGVWTSNEQTNCHRQDKRST